jgi:uncharacterized protein YecE (DUF72 family)
MRKLMKPDFELVVTAWRWLTQDPLDERGAAPLGLNKAHTGMLQVTDENRQIWALVAQQLRASRAHSVLLKTPNTFGPSKTNRTALTQFVKEIIQPGDLQVIWEPRGIWDYEDALEQAQESGVLLASDPFTDGTFPEQLADKAYYVLTGPHGQARFREDDLLRLIDFVDEHDEAVTLVVRGDDRERVASRILRLLETDTGLGEEEVTLDDEAAAVPMASSTKKRTKRSSRRELPLRWRVGEQRKRSCRRGEPDAVPRRRTGACSAAPTEGERGLHRARSALPASGLRAAAAHDGAAR